VTSDQSRLASTTPVTEGTSVQTADGTLCHVTHKGSLSDSTFTVPNIFFVPQLSMDLLLVGQITDHNCFVGFDDSSCFVHDRKTGDVIGTSRRRKSSPHLYILDTLRLLSSPTTTPHVLAASGPHDVIRPVASSSGSLMWIPSVYSNKVRMFRLYSC
jgi:hypothetical protein